MTEQQDKHRVRACKRSLSKEVPQPMLTLMHHNTNGLPPPFPLLEVLLAEPFPQTPEDMLQLEQRLSVAAAQTADQMVLVQLTRAHEAEAFVRQAIAQARAQSPVPLIHKGFRMTSVLLLGGTRIVIETPSLREDRRGRRGRRRRIRGPHGGLLPGARGPGYRRPGEPGHALGDRPTRGAGGELSRGGGDARPSGPGVRRVESGAYQYSHRRDQ